MRFIGLKTCDTCRKALKALEAAGYDVQVTDVRADGLTDAEIEQIVEKFPAKAINKASTTWRGLSDAEKESDPKGLLRAHPTLMKRPVLIGDEWTIGWDKATQAKWLGA
ncbi:arsenate reductase [Loktanella sp. F6476L]|uniref:arsenate reductase family protein n=1 Tax=Loktanella sp. F6476L TaxID=2926405 RepID=UPI001FF598A0|nr:ArsC/Spx/MgsR family protein [Loktanella sp. F6476L]MCK0119124.1 arsenate reductase [Loktanella sp. F6476L]